MKATAIAPGVQADLSADDYHRGPGISSTEIKFLLKHSPAHLRDLWRQYEEGIVRPATPALTFGTAYHTALLEPEKFAAEYAEPLDPGALTGALDTVADLKAACAALGLKVTGKKDELIERLLEADPDAPIRSEIERRHAEQCGDRQRLSFDDHHTIAGMREVMMAHPTLGRVFSEGQSEVSMFWHDVETGVALKIRPDWIRAVAGGPVFQADLKTTVDASPGEFERSIYNFGYHISAAMYLEGHKQITGEDVSMFVLAAQEKVRPYVCAPYLIDDAALEIGRRELRRGVRIIAACLDRDVWPGYGDDMREISLPAWAFRRPDAESTEATVARIARAA